jgi:hypothetical protein
LTLLENKPETKAENKGNESSPSVNAFNWEFADLGYDTDKLNWFLNFFNLANKLCGTFEARKIIMNKGTGAQYVWKDASGRWHIRERFYRAGFDSLRVRNDGEVTLNFENCNESLAEDRELLDSFSVLRYAYHVFRKGEDIAPFGFMELCNQDGKVLSMINNKWILVENVRRETCGDFPHIRIQVRREDLKKITLTQSCIIISG